VTEASRLQAERARDINEDLAVKVVRFLGRAFKRRG
jgi:hypothetical protein